MKNDELIQQIAGLIWLLKDQKSDAAENFNLPKDIFLGVTGWQVVKEIYKRLSKEDEIELAKTIIIERIAEYVRSNPRASEKQLIDFIQKQFAEFAEFLRNL